MFLFHLISLIKLFISTIVKYKRYNIFIQNYIFEIDGQEMLFFPNYLTI